MDQKDFLNQIKNVVLSYDDKAQVILYGSRARGDFKKDSDWDILILSKNGDDYKFQRKLRDNIYDLELEHDQLISTIIMEPGKWQDILITPLYKNVMAEGKAL
jgi:predicted nucleotidyltransferase